MIVPNNANTYLPPVIAIPSALEITDITNSNPMVVTVNANSDQVNTYIPDQVVKLTVPPSYGMIQANGLSGVIIAVTSTTLSLNIDSTQFDSFTMPSDSQQPASLAPSGSKNLSYNNSTNQVAFQSLNNIGN